MAKIENKLLLGSDDRRDGQQQHGDDTTTTGQTPKELTKMKEHHKAKKKRKSKKRKRDSAVVAEYNGLSMSPTAKAGIDEPSDEQLSSREIKKRKKDKKKKEKKAEKEKKPKNRSGKKKDDGDEELPSSTKAERLVASSAIEFFDEAVKANVKNGTAAKEPLLPTKKEQAKELQSKEAIQQKQRNHTLTLLLFYQYVEPRWDASTHDYMYTTLQKIGSDLKLTGRMRVALEGLNCTLTGDHESIVEYCNTLRRLKAPSQSLLSSSSSSDRKNSPLCPFENTEFKLTTDLPQAQRFPNLKVFKVVELVHYGLEGKKAPPIQKYQGTHLEPEDYHKKIAEPNTVIIDVRNHYEAAIGRFVPPQEEGKIPADQASAAASSDLPPPKWLDPKMRKSTEFPQWLDKTETKEEMKGKQVLMYCTGGIRCERASALLKYKMETDPEMQALGIKGVYQLQGGIDKYFKQFPDGGHWRGKNYVFDKRFAHAPPKIDGELHGRQDKSDSTKDSSETLPASVQIMGKCEACHKPWEMYRGKRRCPTCGVPSLICKECFLADKEGRKKLGKEVRCDLCVEQGIFSKRDLRVNDEQAIQAYESKMKIKGLLQPDEEAPTVPANPGGVTRLYLKNMCRKNMTQEALLEHFPSVTHIVWKTDRKSGMFLGSAWVEMANPDDAARAVVEDGKLRLFGRAMGISFQPPDGKDAWPPPSSAVA